MWRSGNMYDKMLIFKGKHATYMKQLAAPFSENIKVGIFKRNLDVYLLAPIVGMAFGRQADVDNGNEEPTRIHAEQLNGEMSNLEMNYRTILLLHDKDKLDAETRITRAFRYDEDSEKRKEGDEIFESYVRGGIEVLHEKLIAPSSLMEDYYKNLFDFVMEFEQKWKDCYSAEEISELCNGK